MTDEDKEIMEKFLSLQSKDKTSNLVELYTELIIRVPLHKQAEYHSEVGWNAFVYQWRYPGKYEKYGTFHTIELYYIFNNFNETLFPLVNDNYELTKKFKICLSTL